MSYTEYYENGLFVEAECKVNVVYNHVYTGKEYDKDFSNHDGWQDIVRADGTTCKFRTPRKFVGFFVTKNDSFVFGIDSQHKVIVQK